MVDRGTLGFHTTYSSRAKSGRSHTAAVQIGAVSPRNGFVDLLAAGRMGRIRRTPFIALFEYSWELDSKALTAAVDRVPPGIDSRRVINAFSLGDVGVRRLPATHANPGGS